jgi:hypothetical protein
MRISKAVLFILALFLFATCSEQQPKSLTVMTWNIWHGGLHGDKSVEFEQDTANTANVLKVLMLEEPDILLMQETYCCGMDIA